MLSVVQAAARLPMAVVATDLSESEDVRTRRAGLDLLGRQIAASQSGPPPADG